MLAHMLKAQTQSAHECVCVCMVLRVGPYEILSQIIRVHGIRRELYACITTVWKVKVPKRKLQWKFFIAISLVGFRFLQIVFLSWVGLLKHNAHFCFPSVLTIFSFFSKQNNSLN